MSRLLIFDADSIVFTTASNHATKKATKKCRKTGDLIPNNRNISAVKASITQYVNDIIKNTRCTHVIGFYGSRAEDAIPNFREIIDPVVMGPSKKDPEVIVPVRGYKYSRPPKPPYIVEWVDYIHEAFRENFSFVPVDSMESDDAVSIAASFYQDKFDDIVISSEDKDLLEIKNVFYYNPKEHKFVKTNFNSREKPEKCGFYAKTEEPQKISNLDSVKHMSIQMILGDTSDCVKGLPWMGATKAHDELSKLETESECIRKIISLYSKHQDVLYDKFFKKAFKECKIKVQEDEAEKIEATKNDSVKHKPFTKQQLHRYARIKAHAIAEVDLKEYFPGGWKSYIKMQYRLLHMLERVDEYSEFPDLRLEIPEPLETNYSPTSGYSEGTLDDFDDFDELEPMTDLEAELFSDDVVDKPEEVEEQPKEEEEDDDDLELIDFDVEQPKEEEKEDDDDDDLDLLDFDDDDDDVTNDEAEDDIPSLDTVAPDILLDIPDGTGMEQKGSESLGIITAGDLIDDLDLLNDGIIYLVTKDDTVYAVTSAQGIIQEGESMAEVMPKLTSLIMQGYNLHKI